MFSSFLPRAAYLYSVYETCGWERQSWETHGGSVTAAQWSPCSAFVVYALSGEHALRYLAVRSSGNRSGSVVPVSSRSS